MYQHPVKAKMLVFSLNNLNKLGFFETVHFTLHNRRGYHVHCYLCEGIDKAVQ